MYSYIKGKIESLTPSSVVIDVGGIGYEILISGSTAANLSSIGSEAKIYTYLHVREDEMSLFGFASKEEKNMFLKLTSVSGVGAKTAQGILSGISVENLNLAIATGDSKMLSGIKGIGKKTVERVLLELKDKVDITDNFVSSYGEVATDDFTRNKIDAIEALTNLGMNKTDVARVVARVAAIGDSAEEIIAKVLRNLDR